MIKYLSYKLNRSIPVYGKAKKNIFVGTVKSISSGDACRVHKVSFENHWGTHIDCPAHFFNKGKTVADYKADFWLFRNPQVVQIKAIPNQIIEKEIFECNIKAKTDLLILKAGWSKFRGLKVYSCQNPGISPRVGLWLRQKYSKLRAIGFDWISLSSFQNRKIGRDAHRVFLNPNGYGHPILIIEDMFIPDSLKEIASVWVAPIMIKGIDSAPCTVIGVEK